MKTARIRNAVPDLRSALILKHFFLDFCGDSQRNRVFSERLVPSRLTNGVPPGQAPRGFEPLTALRIYKRLQLKGQTIVLRAVAEDDIDMLLKFVNQLECDKRQGEYADLFTGFEKKVTRREEAKWLASLLDQIRGRDMVSVLAEVGGQIVANGEVARGDYQETRHHGRLALTVLSAYRGLGIGREIVKVLLREARRIGLKNVEVEFLATNKAAVHTYGKAGFIEVGRIPGKVRRGGKMIDSMIMARRL